MPPPKQRAGETRLGMPSPDRRLKKPLGGAGSSGGAVMPQSKLRGKGTGSTEMVASGSGGTGPTREIPLANLSNLIGSAGFRHKEPPTPIPSPITTTQPLRNARSRKYTRPWSSSFARDPSLRTGQQLRPTKSNRRRFSLLSIADSFITPDDHLGNTGARSLREQPTMLGPMEKLGSTVLSGELMPPSPCLTVKAGTALTLDTPSNHWGVTNFNVETQKDHQSVTASNVETPPKHQAVMGSSGGTPWKHQAAVGTPPKHQAVTSSSGGTPRKHQAVTASTAGTPRKHQAVTASSGETPQKHQAAVGSIGGTPRKHQAVTTSSGGTARKHQAVTALTGGTPRKHQAVTASSGEMPQKHKAAVGSIGDTPQKHQAVTTSSGGTARKHQAVTVLTGGTSRKHQAVTASSAEMSQKDKVVTASSRGMPRKHQAVTVSSGGKPWKHKAVTGSSGEMPRKHLGVPGSSGEPPLKHQVITGSRAEMTRKNRIKVKASGTLSGKIPQKSYTEESTKPFQKQCHLSGTQRSTIAELPATREKHSERNTSVQSKSLLTSQKPRKTSSNHGNSTAKDKKESTANENRSLTEEMIRNIEEVNHAIQQLNELGLGEDISNEEFQGYRDLLPRKPSRVNTPLKPSYEQLDELQIRDIMYHIKYCKFIQQRRKNNEMHHELEDDHPLYYDELEDDHPLYLLADRLECLEEDVTKLEGDHLLNYLAKEGLLSQIENNDIFDWSFLDCTVAGLDDYHRLVPQNYGGQYEDWDIYSQYFNSYEVELEYLRFWKELVKELKWMEDYVLMKRPSLVWGKICSRGCYQAIKIASRFSMITEGLARGAYYDCIDAMKLDICTYKDFDGIYFEIWQRITKLKESFKEALIEVYKSGKFPLRHHEMKTVLDKDWCSDFEDDFRRCTAGITPEVTEDKGRELIAYAIRNQRGRPKFYAQFIEKKIEVAKVIGVLPTVVT